MKTSGAAGINSPIELLAILAAMFPTFASEFDADEEITTYHQVVRRLTGLSEILCLSRLH
jgi:hypothetical protein